jgi:hypothetical protein
MLGRAGVGAIALQLAWMAVRMTSTATWGRETTARDPPLTDSTVALDLLTMSARVGLDGVVSF